MSWIEFKKRGRNDRHFIEGTRSIDWRDAKGVSWKDWNLWRMFK